MATYRAVHLSFWTDSKVEDDFTPEDKYFYLYLITNPHTNLCGCYEISMKAMSRETGYTEETVKRLLDRMENVHHVIEYDSETKEVWIPKWGKYNWSDSKETQKGIAKVASFIKSPRFRNVFVEMGYIYPLQGAYRGHTYPLQASVSDTDTDSDSVIKESLEEIRVEQNPGHKAVTSFADKMKRDKRFNGQAFEQKVIEMTELDNIIE